MAPRGKNPQKAHEIGREKQRKKYFRAFKKKGPKGLKPDDPFDPYGLAVVRRISFNQAVFESCPLGSRLSIFQKIPSQSSARQRSQPFCQSIFPSAIRIEQYSNRHVQVGLGYPRALVAFIPALENIQDFLSLTILLL